VHFDAVFWALKPQMKKACRRISKHPHFLSESVQAITKAGFDRWLASSLALMGEKSGSRSVVQFAEQTAIHHVWHAASAT